MTFSMTTDGKCTVDQNGPNLLRNPHYLSAGTDSLYVEFKPTISALNYSRKHTNFTTSLQERHFLMPERTTEKHRYKTMLRCTIGALPRFERLEKKKIVLTYLDFKQGLLHHIFSVGGAILPSNYRTSNVLLTCGRLECHLRPLFKGLSTRVGVGR